MATETLEPPASVGSALPPQTGEIQLGQSNTPPSTPKPGSPRANISDKLRGKMGGVQPAAPATPPPTTPKAPEAPKPEAQKNEQVKAPETPQTSTKPDASNATDTTSKVPAPETLEAQVEQGKASPWKLVKSLKSDLLERENEIRELRKQVVPEDERKNTYERLTKTEQRAKELEDEIRYVNYTKSNEFKEKYEQPFQRAVGSAMKELQGLSFSDDKGVAKSFDVNVLMELVNLPLHQARAISNNLFGDLSNDVMTHRNRIRENLDEQAAAIDTAKKTGAERETQQREQLKQFVAQTSSFAKDNFNKFKQEILAHPEHGEFFKPKEGDEEWNTRLEKGYEMADKAFSVNVLDTRLTPEQRKEAVKLQAAVYNQAAAWRPMRLHIQRLTQERDALRDELGKYKATTPAAGGQTPQGNNNAPVNGKEGLFQRLRSKAVAI